MPSSPSLCESRDRGLLLSLVARLMRLRDATKGPQERNNIDRELNAVRRVLGD